jgi:hypothetical protein
MPNCKFMLVILKRNVLDICWNTRLRPPVSNVTWHIESDDLRQFPIKHLNNIEDLYKYIYIYMYICNKV